MHHLHHFHRRLLDGLVVGLLAEDVHLDRLQFRDLAINKLFLQLQHESLLNVVTLAVHDLLHLLAVVHDALAAMFQLIYTVGGLLTAMRWCDPKSRRPDFLGLLVNGLEVKGARARRLKEA